LSCAEGGDLSAGLQGINAMREPWATTGPEGRICATDPQIRIGADARYPVQKVRSGAQRCCQRHLRVNSSGIEPRGRICHAEQMSDAKPDLEAAYALETPEDNRRLYAQWAQSYDADFAVGQHYVLPLRVAEAFAVVGGAGPVLDIGAGTGLCGEALARLGIGPLEAVDLSGDMLAVADTKDVYTRLFEGNLLARLPCGDGSYAGAVSSGTFTTGHVGPEALDEVLRVVRPGGWVAISVNAVHFERQNFGAALAARGAQIDRLSLQDVRIYGDMAIGEHAEDLGRIVTFRRR
jgi:ubiquinone/menaquinone biosynthesis C-methylase UbiE